MIFVDIEKLTVMEWILTNRNTLIIRKFLNNAAQPYKAYCKLKNKGIVATEKNKIWVQIYH